MLSTNQQECRLYECQQNKYYASTNYLKYTILVFKHLVKICFINAMYNSVLKIICCATDITKPYPSSQWLATH